ncbi:MAG: O-succinylbenzoate synthase [Bifidobacteriaceae bacterium]|nr:O-succinylbenzoate synthase [Bifidobacteriaceae bacterium]
MGTVHTASGLVGHVYAVDLTMPWRGSTRREGVLLEGPAGWGEFSPFPQYTPKQAVPWLRCAIAAATKPYPPVQRQQIPVNVTVPAVGPQQAAALVRQATTTPPRPLANFQSTQCPSWPAEQTPPPHAPAVTVKVKVAQSGQTLAEEVDRLVAVRHELGPTGLIRIDANGAWDLDTAVDRLTVLNRAAGGLEYAEQPCRLVADLARLRRRVPVPLAADESIRLANDPLAVKRQQAVDFAVLKVQPLGGVMAALALAEQLGLPAVVSSALETSLGLSVGLALAGALPNLSMACGLGTAGFLAADCLTEPLLPERYGGCLPVGRRTPNNLAAIAADTQTTANWAQRLAAVEKAMGEQ